MSAQGGISDAWDDDWVSKADSSSPLKPEQNGTKVSKAERRLKQAELNKKLWQEAETPENPYFINTRNDVPLKSEFKPAMKVLSRKPAPKVVYRTDPLSGLEHLTVEDDEDEDLDDTRKNEMTIEERQQKAQQEREEKQRKYAEARERLFGASNSALTSSHSGNNTPSRTVSVATSKARGKVSGSRDGRSSSSSDSKTRQLYDPNYTAKPDPANAQKKDTHPFTSSQSTPIDETVVRNPKGPDGSGRGGFGFTSRGGKTS